MATIATILGRMTSVIGVAQYLEKKERRRRIIVSDLAGYAALAGEQCDFDWLSSHPPVGVQWFLGLLCLLGVLLTCFIWYLIVREQS